MIERTGLHILNVYPVADHAAGMAKAAELLDGASPDVTADVQLLVG